MFLLIWLWIELLWVWLWIMMKVIVLIIGIKLRGKYMKYWISFLMLNLLNGFFSVLFSFWIVFFWELIFLLFVMIFVLFFVISVLLNVFRSVFWSSKFFERIEIMVVFLLRIRRIVVSIVRGLFMKIMMVNWGRYVKKNMGLMIEV